MESEKFVEVDGGEEGRKKAGRRGTLKQKANTATIYYCNLALGVTMAFLAPVLVEFTKGFQTDMKTMSVIMSVGRAIGLVTSLGFGYIYGHVNRHAIVTLLFFIMAVMLFSIPYSGSLITFASLLTILGIAAGGYGTAQAVWIIDIWKERAGPFIQGQHFFFALGSIIPPTLFAPFLEDAPAAIVDPEVPELLSTFANNDTVLLNPTLSQSALDATSGRILIPTFICAGIVGIGAILLLNTLVAFRGKRRGIKSKMPAELKALKITEEQLEKSAENEIPSASPQERKCKKCREIVLIALSAVLLGTFMALEGTAFQFLPAYTHYSNYKLSQADGARVLSALNVAFTLGRLVGIVAILKVGPKLILVLNILIVAMANLLLLSSSGSGAVESVWVGSILLGIGFSTTVPTVFAFLRAHLNITNMVGSIMLVGGSAAATCYPLIIGAHIETFANVVLWLNLATLCVSTVAFVAIILLIRLK